MNKCLQTAEKNKSLVKNNFLSQNKNAQNAEFSDCYLHLDLLVGLRDPLGGYR